MSEGSYQLWKALMDAEVALQLCGLHDQKRRDLDEEEPEEEPGDGDLRVGHRRDHGCPSTG